MWIHIYIYMHVYIYIYELHKHHKHIPRSIYIYIYIYTFMFCASHKYVTSFGASKIRWHFKKGSTWLIATNPYSAEWWETTMGCHFKKILGYLNNSNTWDVLNAWTHELKEKMTSTKVAKNLDIHLPEKSFKRSGPAKISPRQKTKERNLQLHLVFKQSLL